MRGKEGGPYCETEINNMIGTAIWWIWDWNLAGLGLESGGFGTGTGIVADLGCKG